MLKILDEADTEELRGAVFPGTSGGEVIGAFTTLIENKASYKLFRQIIFPHPTLRELMSRILDRVEPLAK